MNNAAEDARLDALNAYNSTILGHLRGDKLDAVLGSLHKRRGQSDAAYRERAMCGTHPDDMVAALIGAGYTLGSCGIASVTLG